MWRQETNMVSNSQRVCVRWAHSKENLPTHSKSVHACSTAESCVGCLPLTASWATTNTANSPCYSLASKLCNT